MSVVVSGDGEECRGTVAIRHKGGPGLVSNSQRLMWAESVSLPSSANHILLVRVSPSNSCLFFSHSSHRSSIAATIGYGSIKYQYKHTVQVASRAPLAVPHNFVCTSLARAVCRNRGMLSPM